MTKKQRWNVGAIVQIRLPNGRYCYAKLLANHVATFYDALYEEAVSDLHQTTDKPELFKLTVYNDAITSGQWLKIGKAPLTEAERQLGFQFIEDPFTRKLSLYNLTTGEISPATWKDCQGLERAAVWSADHVESRLADHFAGKENHVTEQLKLKRPD